MNSKRISSTSRRKRARFLAAAKIRAVGVDYLSVGGFFKDGPETHQALLGAGIWVIEGLNLAPLQAGKLGSDLSSAEACWRGRCSRSRHRAALSPVTA